MKYRSEKSKFKKEHSMIEGLKKLLESIQNWDEIQGIIPGIINPSKASSDIYLTIQYKTTSGLKCIAKSRAVVQEVFFISNNSDALQKKIEDLNKLHVDTKRTKEDS